MNGKFKPLTYFLVHILLFPSILFGQNTYLENFDEAALWSGGSSGSYTPKFYINTAIPDEDQFYADDAVRESSNAMTGYAWRLRNSGTPIFTYSCGENIESFYVYLAHWNVDVGLSVSIDYSLNSGVSFINLETIDESWWTSQGYNDKEFRQFFSGILNIVPDEGEKIYLRIVSNGNERLLIDDFQLTYNNGSAGVQDPANFLVTAVSDSQIDLIFAPNNSNDDVVIAFNENGLFENPFGPPPDPGQVFSGGTLLYLGLDSPQHQQNLAANQTVYYKAWSYDGDLYSDGLTGMATTSGPFVFPNAWINEIHYDNEGTDVDEFIEIIVENTDNIELQSITLALYNGSNGEIYASETLNNFTIGNTVGGFTFFTWFYTGIQNGAPEGLALAFEQQLIPGQFLSYEGTFLATEGPANGIISKDIGVMEPTSNLPGFSLQLAGSGLLYDHFYWQGPLENSPGELNDLQELGNVTTWAGTFSNDWAMQENWDFGVPEIDIKAYIPSVDLNVAFTPYISTLAQAESLIIEEDAFLEISTFGSLTVHDSLVNKGSFIIRSDESGTGSFIGTMGVQASIERYIEPGQWHYLSSPVQSIFSDVFEGLFLMEWDEPSESWIFIEELGVPLNAGMYGYSLWADEIKTVEFSGSVNTGEQSIEVFYTEGTTNPENDPSGYNLIGNPYPSSLDWDVEDGNGWTRTNINHAIYYWNGFQYASYVKGGPNPGTNGGTNIIPPHQGFYVKCTSASGGLVSVNNDARLHASQDFYKNGDKNIDVIRLQVSGNGLQDETLITIDENATFDFDHEYDAYKLFGNAAAPQLFSFSPDSAKLAINTIPFIKNQMIIPLGFQCGTEPGIHELRLSEISGFENIPVFLEDISENTLVDLRKDKGYKFFAESEKNESRFYLRLFNLDMPVNQCLASFVTSSIFVENGKIYVKTDVPLTANVTLSDIYGRVIHNQQILKSMNCEIDVKGHNGLFLITLYSGSSFFSRKVFLSE